MGFSQWHKTEFKQDCEDLRLDLNYEDLQQAKERYKNDNDAKVFWLQQENGLFHDFDAVDISVEQAEWLAEQLLLFVKLFKGE